MSESIDVRNLSCSYGKDQPILTHPARHSSCIENGLHWNLHLHSILSEDISCMPDVCSVGKIAMIRRTALSPVKRHTTAKRGPGRSSKKYGYDVDYLELKHLTPVRVWAVAHPGDLCVPAVWRRPTVPDLVDFGFLITTDAENGRRALRTLFKDVDNCHKSG